MLYSFQGDNLITDDSNFKFDKALNYFKKGDFHKALSNFEILKKNHNDFLLHWYLGHTYFKLHKYSAAIKSVKKSIQLKSKDTLNLNFLGEIYSTISKYYWNFSKFFTQCLLESFIRKNFFNVRIIL